MGEDVLTEIPVEAGAASGPGRMTWLRLSWRRTDALAVMVDVRSTPSHPCLPHGSWVVHRDLLRRGLGEACGEGVVRLEPLPDAGHVRLHLGEGDDSFRVTVTTSVLRDFLHATNQIVPYGEEGVANALDAALARLRLRRER